MLDQPKKAFDGAKEYMDLLIKPSFEEVGGVLADQVKYWRYSNQMRIIDKAKKLHVENKVNVKPTSVKNLTNILEFGSSDENENLQN